MAATSWHLIGAALGIGLLLNNPRVAFADDFQLPPPPVYKADPKLTAAKNLLKFKVAWLKEKKAAEDKAKKDAQGDEKLVKKYGEMSDQDQKDIDALSEGNALNPFTNSLAGENAKLIKKNVEARIATLKAKYDGASHKEHPDNKELDDIARQEQALADALKQAAKDSQTDKETPSVAVAFAALGLIAFKESKTVSASQRMSPSCRDRYRRAQRRGRIVMRSRRRIAVPKAQDKAS